MVTIERKTFTVAGDLECLCFLEEGVGGDIVLHVVVPGAGGVGRSYREAWDLAGRANALRAYQEMTQEDAQFLADWAGDPVNSGRILRNGIQVRREQQAR